MRINRLSFTKIVAIIQRIPCALVQKMSGPEKVREIKHRASPPLQKVGHVSPCLPTDLRPWLYSSSCYRWCHNDW